MQRSSRSQRVTCLPPSSKQVTRWERLDRCSSSVGDAAVQPLPARDLLAAGRLGREREIFEPREPGLRYTPLCLNGEGVAMSMAEVDQVAKRLNRGVAAGERDEDGLMPRESLHLGKDLPGGHRVPLGLIFG